MTEPQTNSSTEFRDAALQRIMERAGTSFRERAQACIEQHWAGKTGTAEDFRITCITSGIKPHHPNAWGGLTMGLVRSGLLKATGDYAQMKAKKSHSRKTPVYRVLAAGTVSPKEAE